MVRVTTLSDFVVAENIEKIDLLKIDAQKSELGILRGMKQYVWDKTDRFVIEIHDINGAASIAVDLLKDRGFDVTVSYHPLHKDSSVRLIGAVRKGLASIEI